MIRAIVTDIEGTTSSIAFVKDVLFPYAARELPRFLEMNWQDPSVREQISALTGMTDEPVETPAQASRILQQWIHEDRKATPLKALQGMIWKSGYQNGDYQAHIYDDAVEQLRRWHKAGIPLYVYSSGSLAAQKLFFGHSEAGDLQPLFSGHFDTTTGAKQETASYQRIAKQINLPPAEILFLSDVTGELDAARQAGMQTVLVDRDGAAPECGHPRVRSFAEIDAGHLR